jgi:hypothetical protein
MIFIDKVRLFLIIAMFLLLVLPYSLLSWILIIACLICSVYLWRASNEELVNYFDELKRKEGN